MMAAPASGSRPNKYLGCMARLREEWGGRCLCQGCAECRPGDAPCMRRDGLEFAHLQPTGLRGRSRGRAERYLDIRRNPGSYRLKCQPCHRLFDRTRTDGHSGPIADFGPDLYTEAEEPMSAQLLLVSETNCGRCSRGWRRE